MYNSGDVFKTYILIVKTSHFFHRLAIPPARAPPSPSSLLWRFEDLALDLINTSRALGLEGAD